LNFTQLKTKKDEFLLMNGNGWGDLYGKGRPCFWLALHNAKSQLSLSKTIYEDDFANARIVKVTMTQSVESSV
jgi:hypothetical protein